MTESTGAGQPSGTAAADADADRHRLSMTILMTPDMSNFAGNVHGGEESGTDASLRVLYELAARTVAAGVAVLAALALVTGWRWLLVLLAVGFLARTLAGPRFSVLGRLATQVVAPRLGMPRFVPGPPKRFAQSIGLVLTTVATVAAYGFDAVVLPTVLIAGMPAATVGTPHICSFPPPAVHPPTAIVPPGCPTVLIGGLPAARMGDLSACGAPIVVGAPTVLIGG